MASFKSSAARRLGVVAVVAGVAATGCGIGSERAGVFEVPNSDRYGVALLHDGSNAAVILCRPVNTSHSAPDVLIGRTPDGYDDAEPVPPDLLVDISTNVRTEPGEVVRTEGVDGLPDHTCQPSYLSTGFTFFGAPTVEGVIVGNGAAGRGTDRTPADTMVVYPDTPAADHLHASSDFDAQATLAVATTTACSELAGAVRAHTGNPRPQLPAPCHRSTPRSTTGPTR